VTPRTRAMRSVVPTVAVAVGLLMLLSFVATAILASPAAAALSSRAVGPSTGVPAGSPPAATESHHPTPPGGAPSSGRGVFWNNTLLGQAPLSNDSCAYASWPTAFRPGSFCTNESGSPSIASTSAGVMITAATSFSNVSSCPGVGNLTYSEIAVSVSTNGGSSFAAPHYLSNPGCVNRFDYPSAMWPALTALSDGTFVLAYLEYNATASNDSPKLCTTSYGYEFFPALTPCTVSHDRLVVTESSNNGVSWSAPTVINSTDNPGLNESAPIPAQPAIASFGNTVYLAWTNFTYPDFYNYYVPTAPAPSVGLNLVVSTDKGSTWGASKQLPVVPGSGGTFSDGAPWVAYAPALVVNATGALSVAYSTNYSVQTGPICQPSGCGYLDEGPEGGGGGGTFSVVVATSVNNGSTFKLATVANDVPAYWNAGYNTWIAGGGGSMISPEPAIAVDAATGQLYVTYTGGALGTYCSTFGCSPGEEVFENLWTSTSVNGGKGWSAPAVLGDALLGINGTATAGGYLFTPSIGVGAGGTVYINVEYMDDSVCLLTTYYCGEWQDALYESTNHGGSYQGPYLPWQANAEVSPDPFWDGFDSSMTIYQGIPYAAWTWFACPVSVALIGSCEYTSNYAYSQVVVTSLAVGTGITLSFNQTGLPSSDSWSVSISGNVRGGPAAATLSVSGVPIGRNESWTVLPVATTVYGTEFAGTASVVSPGSFTHNATINVTFNESVLLSISTVPGPTGGYPFYCGGPSVGVAFYCGNQDVTPLSGSTWLPLGTAVPYSVFDGGLPTVLCIGCYNFTFVSWSGTGSGSWNTTTPNGTAILNGPANETATFSVTSLCLQIPYYACNGLLYQYDFTEIGLPSGTAWGVTLTNLTNTSSDPNHDFWAPAGPVNFTVDTIPYNSSYSYVGTPSIPSPITAAQNNVTVRFHLDPNAAEAFAVYFNETGVPTSSSGWGLELGATTFGLPLSGETLTLPGGGSGISVNAAPVYGNAGVEGTISSFLVTPDVLGAASYSLLPGASLVLKGPATVTAIYASSYWLEVPTPANGTVNQSSQWVPNGAPVDISATPATGYSFVGWSGTGVGSKSATTPDITVNPRSPVTEVATFAPIAPTYTVTIDASGLPSGANVTFLLGSASYTGPSPLTLTGVAPGTYAVSAPPVALNGTPGEEFLVSNYSSSLTLAAGELTVTADGSVTVTYVAQYLVTMNPTVNGTVSVSVDGVVTPGAGSSWVSPGTVVTINATPATGFRFVGWVGTGTGSYNGTLLQTTVTPQGPVSESAAFVYYVAPIYLYALVLTPTGLPTGTVWSASVGTTAVSGTGPLTLHLENGSYTVSVGTVTPSVGVEYVPSAATFPVTVSSTTPYAGPTFTTMYLVTITGSTGGTASPASVWETAGGTVTLSAVAASGYQFVNWTGTGTGSYSGTTASTPLTVNGPVSELATFVPTASLTKSSSGSGGSDLPAIGLLIALLVVGLVVGLLIARSRPPSGDGGTPSGEAVADTSSVPVWNADSRTTGTAAPPASPESAPGPTEEDSIYGGGSG
jgi:hypothetical protein